MKDLINFLAISVLASLTRFVQRKKWSFKKLVVDLISGITFGGAALVMCMEHNQGVLRSMLIVGLASYVSVYMARTIINISRSIPSFTLSQVKKQIKERIKDFIK